MIHIIMAIPSILKQGTKLHAMLKMLYIESKTHVRP